MLEKYLQDLGLTDKEAVIYLALLQVDSDTALDLSKKTKINRSTVYVVIESLQKKGLVSETTVGKKTQFQAESPERLETYVEKRRLQFEEQSQRLKDIIPEIKSVQRGIGERPVVKYYEGVSGIISASNEVFSSNEDDKKDGEEIHFVYPRDLLNEIFSEKDLADFRKIRLDKKIKSKTLYTYKNGDISSDEMAERIKIDGEKYPITCDIAIYKDKVRISILGKSLSCIFIQSPDVAKTLKSLLEIAFDSLKSKNNQ